MDFWHYVFLIIWFAFLFIWILMVFQVVTDLFRDRETSGWAKALWVVALIALPYITVLIYLIANGGKMAERHAKALETARAAQDTYIREVVSASPSEQIAQARKLLDSGIISEAEYARLKERALS